MPTGYTSDIYDGKDVSFRKFALQCARAFGACIRQRDSSMDEEPKLIEPDIDFHTRHLDEIKNFKKPTVAEFTKYRDERVAYCVNEIAKDAALKVKYENMLKAVSKWRPPTTNHNRLKDFMVDQLKRSIEFDCDNQYRKADLEKWRSISYKEYVKQLTQTNKDSVKYHKKAIEKEIKNVRRANAWISALFKSLPKK